MMKVGLAGSYLRSFNLFEMHGVFLREKELEEDERERGGRKNARGHNLTCLKCKAGLLLNSATLFAVNVKRTPPPHPGLCNTLHPDQPYCV